MKNWKRVLAAVLLAGMTCLLCSCGGNDKLSQLEKDAAEARQRAKEAKQQEDMLRDYLGKH